METGYDILFFWVARMIMLGLEFTAQPPFHTVYLHGLIRAEGGVKMSKTKGNVQDPLELIEEYGTDALRLAVTIGITPGNDFTLTPNILDARRDFVNKLWNIGRFVMASSTAQERRRALEPALPHADAPLVERWIASRLASVSADVTRLLGEFNFGEAARVVHDFIWDEVADWYVEGYKILTRDGTGDGALLAQVYEKLLRLLHPFAPFVTEELWQRLTTGTAERPVALIVAEWPTPAEARDAAGRSRLVGHHGPHARRSDAAEPTITSSRPAWCTRRSRRARPSGRRSGGQTRIWSAHCRVRRLKPIDVLASADESLAAQSIAAVAGGAELLIPASRLVRRRGRAGAGRAGARRL